MIGAEVGQFSSLTPIFHEAEAAGQTDEAGILPDISSDGSKEEPGFQLFMMSEREICGLDCLSGFTKSSHHYDLGFARDLLLIGSYADGANG